MKLLFKQKLFSWFDSYDIYNENNEIVFSVKGQLSWGHKFEIYDRDGNYLVTVKQVIFSWLPRYEIYEGENFKGSIKKEFSWFKPKFTIDVNNWHVEGDFLQWDYTIVDGSNNIIATISKELFNLTDTYVIDVNMDENGLYAMIVVIVIDAIKCSQKN